MNESSRTSQPTSACEISAHPGSRKWPILARHSPVYAACSTCSTVRLVESDAYDIGSVTYLRARVHFVHPKVGERMLEQHHLLTIDDDRITAIDELCTGFFAP